MTIRKLYKIFLQETPDFFVKQNSNKPLVDVFTSRFYFLKVFLSFKEVMAAYFEGEAAETDSEDEQYLFNLSYMKVRFDSSVLKLKT